MCEGALIPKWPFQLNVVFMAEVYCLCHVIHCNIQVIIIGVIYDNLFVVILVVGLRIYSLILL